MTDITVIFKDGSERVHKNQTGYVGFRVSDIYKMYTVMTTKEPVEIKADGETYWKIGEEIKIE